MRSALRGTAGLLAVLAVAGCSGRSGHPARIATGYISHVLCSYFFVSGLDPARVNEEDIAGNPVFRGVNWVVRQEVDQARREVRVRLLGRFESRAVYRDGLGCLNLNGAAAPAAPTPRSTPMARFPPCCLTSRARRSSCRFRPA